MKLTIHLSAVALIVIAVLTGCDENSPYSGSSSGSGSGSGSSGGAYGDIATVSAVPKSYTAVLKGVSGGSRIPDEVGFEYCYNTDFNNQETGRVACDGLLGDYELEATGLTDLMTVYYRAYKVVDDEVYYGKIESFETPQGTYTLYGKTYKFIKVEGGPYGSFSMMQTELPYDAVMEIDGREIGALDLNGDRSVTKGEVREFTSRTNMCLRAPSYEEWRIAATGGFKGNGYTYSGSDNLNSVGWYADNSEGSRRRPAQKGANELGFYDMSGNYAEFIGKFTPEQLDLTVDYAKTFVSSTRNMSAIIFNTTFGGTMACGGTWNSPASACTVDSKIVGSFTGTNKFDCSIYTFRFVYSRPD